MGQLALEESADGLPTPLGPLSFTALDRRLRDGLAAVWLWCDGDVVMGAAMVGLRYVRLWYKIDS